MAYLWGMKRVVVGLSGGVDSSVAALLLKEQGYDVIGLFMRNWHDDSVILEEECPWIDDSADAMLVAEKLVIPFQVVDLSKEYHERIIDYMFAEYERGRTPNPDVLCNREIKFDIFLKKALQLGADFVATGHYCRKETVEKDGKEIYRLLEGKDPSKDQSYFLCQVNQEQLKYALFPIGELLKSEVRELARKADLITAEKKDSQGLCFVGQISLPDFLQQQLKPKEGEIIEIPANAELFSHKVEADDWMALSEGYSFDPAMGKKAGKHSGAYYYTIGQRKGLGPGGTPEPLFAIGIDTQANVVYAGQGEMHPGLYRKALRIPYADEHWVRPDLCPPEGEPMTVLARIRYRQPLEAAMLIRQNGFVFLVFENLQRGITPGQFAAWYLGEELVGSGVIA